MKITAISETAIHDSNIVRKLIKNRKLFVEIASSLLILLFLYTAINKTLDISSTESVLKKTPWFLNFASETAYGVIGMEYVAALFLFIPRTRRVGFFISLALMTAFIAYIIYMKIFIPDLPCSCGGVISTLTWTQHLLLNIFFALLAAIGIVLTLKRNSNPETY
jgi:hypothetical protein